MNKVFVHRYRWSHSNLRKKYRRLEKAGKVEKLTMTKEGWWYIPSTHHKQ